MSSVDITSVGREWVRGDGTIAGDAGSSPTSRRLCQPDDFVFLNDLFCFVRQHVEAFVARDDVVGFSGIHSPGQVGVRCVHCARDGMRPRVKRAVSYPKSIRLVYQAVRNWQRFHLMDCPAMPQEDKDRYLELKSGNSRSIRDAPVHWEESCRRMGMVDTADGIRLRNGHFEVGSRDGSSELGNIIMPRSLGTTSKSPAAAGSTDTLPASLDGSEQLRNGRFEVGVGDGSPESGNISVPRSLGMTSKFPAGVGSTGTLPASLDGSEQLRNGRFEVGVGNGSPELGNIAVPRSLCSTSKSPAAAGSTGTLPASLDRSERERNSELGVKPLEASVDSPNHTVVVASNKAPSCPSFTAIALGQGHGEISRSPGVETAIVNSTNHKESLSDSISCIPNLPTPLAHNGLPLGEASSVLGLRNNAAPPVDLCGSDPPTPSQRGPINTLIEQNHTGCSSSPFSKEAVLERVRLALSCVQAVGQIQQLSPALPSPTEGASGDSFKANQHETQNSCDLHSLGVQLYELFSGRVLCDEAGDNTGRDEEVKALFDASGATQGDRGAQRERKKEKRPGRPGFVPLSDLGHPPLVCNLVSSLLDSNSGGSCCSSYESIGDVEEDLRLMVSEPKKYLFHVASGHFQIDPRTLYCRDGEKAKLLEKYDYVTDPSGTRAREMILLSGYSGTGKTSIVESIKDRFIEKGACFVSGKFDGMQKLKPLSAMVSAIDDYCGLLANDSDRIDAVRETVSSGIVGNEGRAVLADLIPNLAKIVDSEEESLPAAQVDGRGALQRILFMIRMLFQATCSCAYPVVLFLDDLQWADEISLLLLEALVSDKKIEGLLFIGSFRDNEVGADHPLMKHLATFRHSGAIDITSICIGNLDLDGVNSLLSDALHLTPRMTRSLGKAVLQKTGGNPLFVVQFLAYLYEEGLLYFSLSSRQWEWDIGKINDRDIAVNVVDLMTAKLLKLAPEVLEALRLAAAFGAQCQEDLLTILDSAPDRFGSTTAALDVAVAEGIMNKVSSAYRFAHDQLQDAAYLLIPESERQAFHLQIGRLLWKLSSEKESETYLFVIVDQLHRGRDLITDHDEKVALAHLSKLAGEMASGMSAFLPASAYMNAGVDLLVDEDWHSHRDLCFDLSNLCAETEYTLGNFDSMRGHADEILSKGRTLQEKIRAYHILVLSLGAQGRISDAINMSFSVLDQLGETLPSTSSVEQEIRMTITVLSTEDEDSLLHLKTMQDSEKLDAMRFLHAVLLHTYLERTSYFPIVACRMVRLSLSHGVCKESARGFAAYGNVLCGTLGMFSEGYQFGKLALSIIDRFQASEHFAKVCLAMYGVISHWSEPIQSALPPLERAIEIGLATGDTEHAMIIAHVHVGVSFGSGVSLGPLAEEMKIYSNQMLQYKQNRVYVNSKPCYQTVLNLLGRSADPTKLVGEEMDERSLLDSVEDSDHLSFLTCSFRMWLEYMFGEYQLAWRTSKSHADLISKPTILVPQWCYNVLYTCLAALALARIEGENEYSATIEKTMTQMTTWARANTWNCQNKLELMKAEYAYLKGDVVLAAKCYNLAVDLAVEHRFIHEQALALERFGIYHMETGDHVTASSLLARARECYSKWGAVSKVAHIDKSYL